jgi:hypothetical protein
MGEVSQAQGDWRWAVGGACQARTVTAQIRTPPGWPKSVPPPGADGWEPRAVAYLLDLAPGDFRTEPLYARQPRLLAWRVQGLVEAQLESARAAYSRARAELREDATPEVVAEMLQALEREGAALLARRREVDLVSRALRGEAFVPRM